MAAEEQTVIADIKTQAKLNYECLLTNGYGNKWKFETRGTSVVCPLQRSLKAVHGPTERLHIRRGLIEKVEALSHEFKNGTPGMLGNNPVRKLLSKYLSAKGRKDTFQKRDFVE